VLNLTALRTAACPLPADPEENIQAEEARYGGGLLPFLLPGDSPMLIYHHLGVWKHGCTIVVRFGDHRILDEFTVKKIAEELYDVAHRADCQHLVLDFSSVLGLSSLMLGKLLMLRKKMSSKGGKLILCDLTPEVEEVLASTKIREILDVMDSEADALKALA